MPRYYCDYCDTYLTHDSPSVRKQHNAGYKHKANARTYYQQFEEQQTQSLIDQRIKEHLGQAAALQQVGAAYAAWRARGPVPMMPIPGLPPGAQLGPGIRPPVLPRPMGAPLVYGAPPPMAPPPVSGQQGVPAGGPMPTNGPPGHPAINMPTSAPGAPPNLGPGGAPAGGAQPMYQGAPTGPNYSGAPPNMSAPPSFPTPHNANADSFSFSPAPNNSNQ